MLKNLLRIDGEEQVNMWQKSFLGTTTLVALAVLVSAGLMTGERLEAQAPTAQSPAAPQWQIDAGGKLEFDVASVKPDKSNNPAAANFFLGPGDGYVSNGGLFSATNQPLIAYLRFAYKLGQGDLLDLPMWVYNDRFDIDARSQVNPTKDQMRLMMQSLLRDRFNVAVHIETKQEPVYALMLLKVGKTGPQLRQDAEPCAAATGSQTTNTALPAPELSSSGLHLPAIPCGSIGQYSTEEPGNGRLVGRNVTIGRIAVFLKNPFTGIERPVIDRTGLSGAFDFSLEWSVIDRTRPSDSQPPGAGPTFLEALRDQLGLKLESTKGPVDVIVIDHVEEPSPN
jgi:uncharacterized protein (TIGR03435 family)